MDAPPLAGVADRERDAVVPIRGGINDFESFGGQLGEQADKFVRPLRCVHGPGTNHPTDGQVRAGDRLQVTGRNADGNWLQVMHPVKVGEHIWIYGPLTDIDAAAVQTLAEVTTAEIEVATPPEPEPIVEAEPTPAPEPVVQPEPETPSVAVPTVPADCTRRHTVNPNETHLKVITDWFGLDLAATAALNGIALDTPLTAGTEICLPDAPTVAQPQPQPQPAAPAPQPAAGGVCQTPIGPQPCIQIPDFPERGHPNAPIGPFVESASPYVWHALGTYERDLPGLDYDFELVFTDNSVMWDWRIRDFEACYGRPARAHGHSAPRGRPAAVGTAPCRSDLLRGIRKRDLGIDMGGSRHLQHPLDQPSPQFVALVPGLGAGGPAAPRSGGSRVWLFPTARRPSPVRHHADVEQFTQRPPQRRRNVDHGQQRGLHVRQRLGCPVQQSA